MSEIITYAEITDILNSWLDQGDPNDRPTNRDIVDHDKVDKELLHHLVSFVVWKERQSRQPEIDALKEQNAKMREALLQIASPIADGEIGWRRDAAQEALAQGGE